MIFQIVAMANNRVIGKNNKLPWHFSSDLQFFKKLTMGQTIIMGRKTFESIGKPLPGRVNFVLTKKNLKRSGITTFDSIESALVKVSTGRAFIIGGAQIFEQTMNLVDGIYMTRIYADFEGDTYYPEVPKNFAEEPNQVLQENPKLEVIFYKKKD